MCCVQECKFLPQPLLRDQIRAGSSAGKMASGSQPVEAKMEKCGVLRGPSAELAAKDCCIAVGSVKIDLTNADREVATHQQAGAGSDYCAMSRGFEWLRQCVGGECRLLGEGCAAHWKARSSS